MVATPCPLNPAKTGKYDQSQHKGLQASEGLPVVNYLPVQDEKTGRLVANHPLAMSISRTGTPVFHPRTLITFVALHFRCHVLYINSVEQLPVHTAVGIDPRR